MTRGFTSDIFSRSSILEWAAVLLLVVGAREFGVTQASAAEPRHLLFFPSIVDSIVAAAAGSNADHRTRVDRIPTIQGRERRYPQNPGGYNEVNVVFTVTTSMASGNGSEASGLSFCG